MKSNTLRKRFAYNLSKQSKVRKERILSVASESILSSRKNRPSVNLGEISGHTKEDSRVLVPGKVLGGGVLDHKVTVVAYSFSQSAKQKITSAGGKYIGLSDYLESGQDTGGMVLLG